MNKLSMIASSQYIWWSDASQEPNIFFKDKLAPAKSTIHPLSGYILKDNFAQYSFNITDASQNLREKNYNSLLSAYCML